MLGILRRLRHDHFIPNDPNMSEPTRTALQRLAELGLVDPGYANALQSEPFIWVANGNGERVLRYVEKTLSPKFKIHPRARTTLESLTEEERGAVISAVEALLLRDQSKWTDLDAIRLAPDKPVYLVRVTPDLHAFLSAPDAESVELFDIVREDTLRLFLERYRKGAHVG